MKITKNRYLVIFLLITILLQIFSFKNVYADFIDTKEHWAKDSINKWSVLGIIQGFNGFFRPNDPITRGEMAVIINRIMKYQNTAKNNFADLNQDFYTESILKANAAGVIKGDGIKVRPKDYITRQEAVVMLGRALGLKEEKNIQTKFLDTSDISEWAIGYVNAMVERNYIKGYNGKFYPLKYITRAEVITILDNAIKKLCNEPKEYSGNVSGTVIINTSDVTIRDMEIKEDLIISEGVGNGNVVLNNTIVLGNTIVRGGGDKSIHIEGNSKISNLLIDKTDEGAIRIKTSAGAIIDSTVVEDTKNNVILEGNFNNINISNGKNITLTKCKIEKLEVNSENSSLEVSEDAEISTLIFNENAKNAVIVTLGKINNFVINSKIKIENNGTIAKTEINANGVIIDGNKPQEIIVKSNVSQPPTNSEGKAIIISTSGTTGGSESTSSKISVNSIGSIIGIPKVGSLLTAGAIFPSGATVIYQWKISDKIDGVYVDIPGANSNTYTPTESDVGKFIKVSVTGTGQYKGTVISAPTPAIALSAKNLNEIPSPTFNPEKGNKLPVTGYYEQYISNNNLNRTVKIYIPQNARMREYFVVLALESGTDIDSFLVNSGWKDIADKNNVCLMILVPKENQWGDYESEKAYLDYVLNQAGSNRNWYSVFGVHYFVGYGDGGDILQTWAAHNPLFVISQVYIDSKINAQKLNEAGNEEYGSEITTFENVPKKDVPIPTWLIGEQIDNDVISYWKQVNDCAESEITDNNFLGSTVYFQDKENSNAIATSFSDVVSQVMVLKNAVSYENKTITNNIYEFLSKYTRYDNTSVYGNVLGYRPNYEEMGVERNYIYMKDEFGQTWKREYLIYVPKNSKDLWPNGAPVVIAFAGNTQPDHVFFDCTHWWEVADKYGFIVVVPCSTGTVVCGWNRGAASKTQPDDIKFVETLIDEINEKYNTDPKRIYATGQSLGCMFIQLLAMKIPEKFAAIGGTSGPIMGQNSIPSDASNDILPVYLVFGEYDYWPWKVGQLEEGDFLGTMGAAQAGYSLFTQEYWINRNVLGSIDNYEITHQNNLPQNKDNSIMYIVKPNSQVYPGDRYKTFTWFNENGIPLFVWTQSAGRAHNCVVSDLWKLWEDWFSKWIREDEETLLYIESENSVKEVKTKPITKAEFIAKIADYFDWPHPSEYNDIWHPPLKQFNDVKTTDKYGKEIECAYEENLIAPDENGNFNPESTISRQEAAKIFVKAFKLPETDIELNFDDVYEISEDALSSVKTLVGLGYMKGRTQKLFKPNAPIMREEVDEIFNAITSTMVSPVQALPKAYYTAPRRYIKLYCPTPGATIYFTKSVATDLSSLVEPPMPDINNPDQIYTVEDDGHIKEDYPQNEHTYVMYKAVAVKDGMVMSPVQTFVWHLYRPRPENADFGHTLILEKTETSPAVYSIYNDSESVRPMAWYIEGNEKGLLFDALQTNASIKNLKEYIDANIATKPYIVVIGHEHIDHAAQVANFVKAGIEVYCNKRGWSSLRSYLPDPADQAKVKNIDEGDIIDMGDFKLYVYALPGHANGNIILQDKENGLIFASDIYGCTRAGSADNVNVSGLRVDLLLSFTQQVYSNYKKDGGKINWLFTGHDETPLKEINLKLFEAALQQVIDYGEAACRPTLRGGNDPAYTRTTMIGDMWKDGTNWIALRLAGKMGDNTEYLSSTTDIQTLPYMSEMADLGGINYNFGGHIKYSVLSNIEIEGGKLVGKTVQWAKIPASFTWAGETITVPPELPNKFNPWSFDYTIEVPEENDTITIIPTTMSTKVKSIKINDQEVGYRSRNTITVTDGQVIEITVVAPDGETTSTYRFIIKKVSNQPE